MANERIRQAAVNSGVKLWQIAARWGCNDGNFSRKLRHQFTQEDEFRALEIIDQCHREGEQSATNENDQANHSTPPGE